MNDIDVIIVGGGPAGLQAALTLGRARRQVWLFDAGPRRNARAVEMHNFLTRDGTPPQKVRDLGHEELARYSTVTIRDEAVTALARDGERFVATSPSGTVRARGVILATGMIDQMLPIEGFAELWGHGIVQCPYCHGFEQADQRFGILISMPMQLEMALLLRTWTADITAFVADVEVEPAMQARLTAAGVKVERRAVRRVAGGGHIERVEVEGGAVPIDLLFAKPPQSQVPLVMSIAGLDFDEMGFVKVDARGQTSIPRLMAAGDLASPLQAAIAGAAAGMAAAAVLNHSLAGH